MGVLGCRDQGGSAPLQEIAGSFARFFGQVDVEKLDVAAGFVMAEIMQVSSKPNLKLKKSSLTAHCWDSGLPSCR
jgi:hypothetical protein